MLRRQTLVSACGLAALAALVVMGLGGAAASPQGMLLGFPGPLALALVVVAVAALARWGADASASAPLLILPGLLLSGLPIPGLPALSGPPLLAVAAAGLVALAAATPSRFSSRALVPSVLLLYLCVAARTQSRVGPQGDEPHYLMVADSILTDHDLDLTRDYALGRYRAFHPEPLEPHYRVRGRDGEIYSLHALGLSLLILPAYGLFGYAGASFLMALLAALLVREIRLLVRAVTGREDLATGVAWAVALSPPLIHYAGLIFTEVPAALLVAIGLRHAREAGRATPTAGFLVGSALAVLPWLNVRYALFPAILLGYAAFGRPRARTAVLAAIPLAVSALAIAAYHLALYGFFDPRRVYGRRPEFALSTLADGLPGLLLDQEFGLLVYAPLFVLAVPGIPRLWRIARRDAAVVIVLVLLVLLTAGTWDMWRGGFNPPARFLVPIVPALALAVASAFGRGLPASFAMLIGWGLWAGLAGAADPALVHRDRDGTAPFFRVESGALEWTRLLPSYVLADGDRHRLAAVWAAALLAAALARGGRPSGRGLTASVAGLMVACVTASHLSHAVSEGREAARLLGRTALHVPGWGVTTEARWGPEVLTWGPLYEPHRHPDGAVIGGRLRLEAGTYRVGIEADPELPVGDPPVLEVRREASGAETRAAALSPSPFGWAATFDVARGEQAGLSLSLRGGSPFLLKAVTLDRSTFSGAPGPKQ